MVQDNLGHVIVKMGGKNGVLNNEGKWIVKPEYSVIERLYFGERYDDQGIVEYTTLYKLDQTEYQFFGDGTDNAEVVGDYRIFLATDEGKLISEEPFQSVQAFEGTYGTGRLQISRNGKIGYIGLDLSLEMSPYLSIYDYLSWKIADDGERKHILNYANTEIGVFEKAEVPMVNQVIYDDYGEPIDYYSEQGYEPYLVVRRGDESAIFGLDEQKVVSPWSTGEKGVAVSFPNETERLYVVYDTEKERYAYFHAVMDSPSDFSFDAVEFLSDHYLLTRNGDQNTLLVLDRHKGPYELLHAPEIGWSGNIFVEGMTAFDEIGEEYTLDSHQAFRSQFVYYKDEQGHYGIVTQDHKVLPAKYDSLVQNPGLDYIIDVQRDGKWGSVDIRNGKTVDPAYDAPLVYQFDPTFMIDYAFFEEQSYYLSSDGRRFYSMSGEFVPFKEKGRYGLKAYSDFETENGERVVVIPAIYKEIRTGEYPHVFVAKGENGKYGLISNFNDTLLPFIHTEIQTDWSGLIMDATLFETFVGKKKGVYSVFDGRFIPAEYDELTSLYDGYGVPAGVVVRKEGKTGLVNMVFELVLPCEYDGLLTLTTEEMLEIYVSRNGKWYTAPGTDTYTLTEKKMRSGRAYDLVVNHDGYVKTPDGYDHYEIASGVLLEKGISETEIGDPNAGEDYSYRLFVRDGKIGAKDEKGKEVLKPSLTCVMRWEDDVFHSLKNGEPMYYVLSTNKQYKASEW
jgi:hypothetical protein